MDTPLLVAFAPKLIVALYGALFDLALLLCGSHYIKHANLWLLMIVNYTSWASLFFNSRMIVSNFEAGLFLLGIYFWKNSLRAYRQQKKDGTSSRGLVEEWKARAMVTLTFTMRGVNIVCWVPIFIKDLVLRTRQSFVKSFLKNCLHGIIAIGLGVAIETVYYGELTSTNWNFFIFNVT